MTLCMHMSAGYCSCPGLLNQSFSFAFVESIGVNTCTESSKYGEGVIKKNATPHFVILVFYCASLGSSLGLCYLIIQSALTLLTLSILLTCMGLDSLLNSKKCICCLLRSCKQDLSFCLVRVLSLF